MTIEHKQIAIGISAIIAALAALYFLNWLLGPNFASVATVSATFVFGTWSFKKTKEKEAEARLFSEKAKAYESIIELIRDLMFSTKGWTENQNTDEVGKRFAQIRYKLLVWGSQDILRAIDRVTDTEDPAELFNRMTDLYALIRRDLGHNDDDLFAKEFMIYTITKEDRDDFIKLLK